MKGGQHRVEGRRVGGLCRCVCGGGGGGGGGVGGCVRGNSPVRPIRRWEGLESEESALSNAVI